MLLLLITLAYAHQKTPRCGANDIENQTHHFASSISLTNGRVLQEVSRESKVSSLRLFISFQDISDFSDTQQVALRQYIHAATKWYENALMVYRLKHNLGMSGINACLGIEVPETHKTDGIDGDVLVYVTASDLITELSGWGGFCAIDPNTKQPVAGRIHLNMGDMEWVSEDVLIARVAHQLGHVLGFNDQSYQYWRRPDGILYVEDEMFATELVRGKMVKKLITPNVASRAKEHFQCTTLNGVELEDEGSQGIAGAHWESFIMYNDVMTTKEVPDAIYSYITLAAFEDSGWYIADYSYGQQLLWGKDKGCRFADDKCVISQNPAQSAFCNTEQSEMISQCDYKHANKGYCNIVEHQYTLESYFQYFGSKSKGGSDAYMDFCPIVLPFPEGNCRDENSVVIEEYGESYGINSRCIEGTYVRGNDEQGNPRQPKLHAGCHRVQCLSNMAQIEIGDQLVECPFTGGEVVVDGFLGVVHCPDTQILCQTLPCLNNCQGVGQCLNGYCKCEDDSSLDCQLMLKQTPTSFENLDDEGFAENLLYLMTTYLVLIF